MSHKILKPAPPFIWPEARVLMNSFSYDHPFPFYSLLDKVNSFFGIVYDLNDHGVSVLQNILQEKASVKCKLIVALYPACLTTRDNLKQLLDLKAKFLDRFSVRVLATDLSSGGLSNILSFYSSDDEKLYFMNGPTPNFGLPEAGPGRANFVFEGDYKLLNEWKNWFDVTFSEKSAPLTHDTIDIPPLIPATGTQEAAQMWREYLAKCNEASSFNETPGTPLEKEIVAVNEDTGKVSISINGNNKQSPTDELELPRFDPIAQKISLLYEKGWLVTFDKMARIPPLDAPMKAAWFGVEGSRKEGSISREIKYRISVLDDDILNKLENKRKAGKRILDQLSFPLGDGQRWMPRNVVRFFEEELDRVNREATTQLEKALSGSADDFIEAQKDRVIRDANLTYQNFFPGRRLSEEVIKSILMDLKDRLAKALEGKFLPGFSYNAISFNIGKDSDWVSQWSQPVILLRSIAEFPRKSLADPFFLRGIHIDRDDLVEGMNVCDDTIFSDGPKKNVFARAKNELLLLGAIMESKEEQRCKCEAILAVMAGGYCDE